MDTFDHLITFFNLILDTLQHLHDSWTLIGCLLCSSPPSLPGGLLLSVDVDDVLHKQVPLQAVHSVAVQHHLMAARRTAEAAAVRHAGGTTGLPNRVS